jgi:hypothetical protein
MGKEQMKKCLTSLSIKEMQIKDSTSLLLEWLPARTQTKRNDKKPLYTAGGNAE